MADPISIIGTAAGLVSLGLQVYSGVKSYIDAVQGRQDDIAGVCRQVHGLKGALEAIEGSIQSRLVNSQTSVPVAVSCLQSCEIELNTLKTVLIDLTTSPSTSPKSTLRAKINEGKRKMRYPFQRSNIARLEERLRNVNLTLHTALHALGIDMLATISDTLSNCGAQPDSVAADILFVRSEATSISASMHNVNQTLPAIMGSVEALTPLIQTESMKILNQIRQEERIPRQDLAHLKDQMRTSFLSQGSQLNRIESRLADRLHDERLKCVEEILEGLELTDLPGRQADSTRRYLCRLVAKPDNLKILCDEFTPCELDRKSIAQGTRRSKSLSLRTSKRVRSDCCCEIRRGYKRRCSRWGSLFLYRENDGIAKHFQECEWSKFDGTESSQTIGATYFGSGTLLRRAVGITFSMKYGSGGASMSSNLVYYNVVDSKTAPVFRLMNLLNEALRLRNPSLSEYDLDRLFEACSSRIRRLYRVGKAGPKDLTTRGKSVMHEASFLVRLIRSRDSPAPFRSLRHFITKLLSYGIPVGLCDYKGRTPLATSLTALKPDATGSECAYIYDLLFSNGSDLPISDFEQAGQLCILYIFGKLETLLRMSPRAAEVIGCNSLSIAVLQRNLGEVQRLAKKAPSLCIETNAFYMTPIHFATNWPDGMKVLLNGRQLPPMSTQWKSPLVYSASHSSSLCKEGNTSVLCSGCSCFECTEMLLRCDCSLSTSFGLGEAIRKASFRTKVMLLESLKDRRLRLRAFALEQLSNEESKLLGLDSVHIPDWSANEIIYVLQKRGLEIPESLQIGSETPRRNAREAYWGSAHHIIDNPATADILLGLGFNDVDSLDTHGKTPLSMADSPEYALLLIDHGADISATPENPIGSKLNQITAHGVATNIGPYLHLVTDVGLDSNGKNVSFDTVICLLYMIFDIDAADSCSCICSAQGCTPFIALLKSALFEGYSSSRGAGMKKVFSAFNRLFKIFPLEVHRIPWVSLAILRYLTFESLEIRHTCCLWYCEIRKDYDEDDFEEIREEDSALAQILEELIEEFEAAYDSAEEDLVDFVRGYWKGRMEEVLIEMEGCKTTDEQRRNLEEIGVKWYEKRKEVPRIIEVEEEEDLNYWIRKMDEIVTE